MSDERERDYAVLVVDDVPDAADSLATVLRLNGFAVRVAYDGEQAVRELRDWTPDAVLADIHMPRMSGYGVAMFARSAMRRPPFLVAVTASTDEEHALRVGFDRHVSKPIDPDELVDLLRRRAATVQANPPAAGDELRRAIQDARRAAAEARAAAAEARAVIAEVRGASPPLPEPPV
jgi:CheY-like chemotaxis protein